MSNQLFQVATFNGAIVRTMLAALFLVSCLSGCAIPRIPANAHAITRLSLLAASK
jgi:hypothetical protein